MVSSILGPIAFRTFTPKRSLDGLYSPSLLRDCPYSKNPFEVWVRRRQSPSIPHKQKYWWYQRLEDQKSITSRPLCPYYFPFSIILQCVGFGWHDSSWTKNLFTRSTWTFENRLKVSRFFQLKTLKEVTKVTKKPLVLHHHPQEWDGKGFTKRSVSRELLI